jgi:DNA-binding LytR/AlgR family response regulator
VKILIVDDERPARERLKQMLSEHEDVESVLEASSAEEAIAVARAHDLDLILLDIAMPGVDGLSMARDAVGLPPIVFTTAHREHAVEAFEVAALDYLLKPIKRERLAAALDRVRAHFERALPRLHELLDEMRSVKRPSETVRITARHGDAYEIFDALEVSRFSAADKYVVCTHQGKEIVLDQSLSDLEKLLSCHDFMRIHRAELVNLRSVRRVMLERRTCTIELNDGQMVLASRRFIPELRKRLGIDTA